MTKPIVKIAEKSNYVNENQYSERSFSEAMAKYGLHSNSIIQGEWVKLKHCKNDKSGYYKFDFYTGVFGCHRCDKYEQWRFNCDTDYDPVKWEALKAEIEKRKNHYEKEKAKQHQRAAETANQIWNKAQPCEQHPYLSKKQVKSYGLKHSNDNLLIPVYNSSDNLISLQRIYPDGNKKFHTDASSKGFFKITGEKDPVIICEGYATGASLHEITGQTVIIAFNAGNLARTAELFPGAVIAADNDILTKGNPGLTAAKKTGLKYIFPDFEKLFDLPDINQEKLTDFNDLHTKAGPEEVKKQINTGLDIDVYADFEKLITDTKEERKLAGRIATLVNESNLSDVEKELLRKKISKKTGLSVVSIRPDPTTSEINQDEKSAAIDKINEKYGVIRIGGKTKILWEHKDINNNDTFSLMGVRSFREYFLNKKFDNDPLADIWLESHKRREFKNIVFQPEPYGKDINAKYPNCKNLWTGLAIKPKRGECTHIQDHIGQVICNMNNTAYEWFLDWTAFTLQNLGSKRPKTAVVIHGEPGAGKSTLALIFKKIFGQHYTEITRHENITGRHNEILQNKVFVYASEAFFHSDHKSANILKGEITQPTRIIEPKFISAYEVKNHSVFLIDSNDDHVIKAGRKDRRYTVLTVNDKFVGNQRYFDQLYKEIERESGPAAFLYEMLNRTIKNDVTKNLKNDALRIQKLNSLPFEVSWWYEILTLNSTNNLEILFGTKFDSEILYNNYIEYCDKLTHNIRRKPKHIISRIIKKIHPEMLIGKREIDTISGNRIRPLTLPNLEQARLDFDQYIGQSCNW